jgi:fatty acid desaturase
MPAVIPTVVDALKGVPMPRTAAYSKPVYTWEQVAEHNTEKSAWVYMGKKVYDITEWLDRHPGGKSVLLLVAGRDVSDLLPSYHPFSARPATVLEKYEIGEISTAEFPQYLPDRGFYADVRREVAEYFRTTGYKPKDPIAGLWRLVFMLMVACASFIIAYTTRVVPFDDGSWNTTAIKIAAATIFGVFQALPLLHAMHDCSHTAFGPNESWWLGIGRLTMDWFSGASLTSWHNQHVLGHHVYTNVLGADPDLPVKLDGDLRRVTRLQRWTGYYRYQHIYMLILYGLLGLKFRIQDVTETMMAGTNGAIRVNLPAGEIRHQIVVKTLFVLWRIVLPLLVCRMPLGLFMVCFMLSELATGYFLAFNFQVSHVSPDVVWPELAAAPAQHHFEQEWAIAQVATTVDYAHGNWIATFLCGALNYQTVHHLFPCVSQYHYPAIAPIVMRVAARHNVRYNRLDTFTEAFVAHWRHLKTLGATADAPGTVSSPILSSTPRADVVVAAAAAH